MPNRGINMEVRHCLVSSIPSVMMLWVFEFIFISPNRGIYVVLCICVLSRLVLWVFEDIMYFVSIAIWVHYVPFQRVWLLSLVLSLSTHRSWNHRSLSLFLALVILVFLIFCQGRKKKYSLPKSSWYLEVLVDMKY